MGFDESNVLTDSDFLFFRDLIFRLSGITMGENKRELINSRIKSFLRTRMIPNFGSYREILSRGDSTEIQTFVNLLTTNKTEFFREAEHFDFLADLAKRVKSKTMFKVWCAASSTGEEPFTLAMVLKKYLPPDVPFRVLATDIDTKVLRFAQNGVYPRSRLVEIPTEFQEFLSVGKDAATADWFKMKDSVHQNIEFKYFNLNGQEPLGEDGFDLIFCRNVLIYFSVETNEALTRRLSTLLKPSGHLVIGHAESLRQSTPLFRSLRPSIFVPAERA